MNHELIRIGLAKSLKKELYELFEGEIIEEIMLKGKVGEETNYLQSIYEGHSFKITKELAPHLHSICSITKKALGFTEDVEFFITNSSETNALAIPKFEEEDKHLIILNSELIERFDDDELKFVIGHEIGHLISGNSEFERIIHFVFPDFNNTPLVFQNKISLWQKLSELEADRYGFIASPNLNKCISNFFKLASGLNTKKFAFDPRAYLQEVDRLINKFNEEPLSASFSHPVNPIRIKALQYFSESKLFLHIKNGTNLHVDKDLEKKVGELSDLLMVLNNSDLSRHRTYFIASAGLIVALSDKEIDKQEIEHIVEVLSGYTMYPKVFLDEIARSDKLNILFQNSALAILKQNPGERFNMFKYLVAIALADQKIMKNEIIFLYSVGKSLFRFSEKEIAQIIGEVIQKSFYPRLFKH